MAKDYDTATAPYNFVSLPQGVLTSPIEGDAMSDAERVENYRAHVLAKGRLSGRIDLEIKTLTPVFIGTGVDAGNAVENFFAPTGIPILPGSSLRGMIKNLFKIVTCSAMRAGEDYHDQVLYFRTLADREKICRDSTQRRWRRPFGRGRTPYPKLRQRRAISCSRPATTATISVRRNLTS